MSQTMSREERIDALEQFAASEPGETVQLPAVVTAPPPPSLIHGSLPIAGALRDERKVLQIISVLAAQAGDAFYYRFPVRSKSGETSHVEGLSKDGAMAVMSAYGNCDTDCWVSGEGHDYWEFTARFIDLERGVALTRPFRQRKGAARMGRDSARNLDADYQIGVSKALRNVITNALGVYADFAFQEAKGALVERVGRDLPKWRSRVSERLSELRIALPRVEAIIGRQIEQWLAPDIAKAITLIKGISDGMATADETFPPLAHEVKPDERDRLNAELDAISNAAGGATPSSRNGDQQKPGDPITAGKQHGVTAGETAPDSAQQPRSPSTTAEPDAAAGGTPPVPPAAVLKVYEEMVGKLLQLASDKTVDEQFKLEQLDQARLWWEDQLPQDWHGKVKIAVQTAASVVKDAMGAKDARRYLLAL